MNILQKMSIYTKISLQITPWGFRKILKWAKDEYNNPEIYITENGIAINETYNDVTRINYIKVC